LKYFLTLLTLISMSYGEMAYQDDIDEEEAFELFQEGAIIIDVRTPSEFIHTGHGLGHINIPVLFQEYKLKPLRIIRKFAKMEQKKGKAFNTRKLYKIIIRDNPNFFKNVMKVANGDLEAEIILICHSGRRSKFASNLLAKKGFENIYNLDGGFLAWQKAKYPWGQN